MMNFFLQRNARERALLIVVAIIVFILLNFLIFQPLPKVFRNQKSKIIGLKQDIDLARGVIDEGRRWREVEVKWQNKLNDAKAIKIEQTTALYSRINRIKDSSGVKIEMGISPLPEKDRGEFLIERGVETTFNSSMKGLVHFLAALEEDQALLRVARLHVNSDNDAGKREVRANIAIVTFIPKKS